jgi:sRNA-binding carbon storage regulator CsrA
VSPLRFFVGGPVCSMRDKVLGVLNGFQGKIMLKELTGDDREVWRRALLGTMQTEGTVLGIHKDRVKLGFMGPSEVPIHREELLRRIGPDQASHPTVRLQEATDSKGM